MPKQSASTGAAAYGCRADFAKTKGIWIFMGRFTDMPINTASLVITPQMLAAVAGIDEFKGAWRPLGTLALDRLSALQRVTTIESIGSSTRITDDEVVDLTGANRNTVKKHLQMLVSASHLVLHGSGKATWYSRV